MHNVDDYAWYEVGNQKYYNKTQALFDHMRYQLPIHWNVTDADYDLYDWSVEPVQSLESLYAQRAEEIRAKYDYLILHFSGGSDSANILETFIRNNIHLDEILIRGSYSATNQKSGVINAVDQYSECVVQAMPLAQWVKDNHMPHVKITLVDTVETVYKFYAKNPKWIEENPSTATPSDIIKLHPDLLDSNYTKLSDRGLRVGHIIGVEKPTIFREKNYFYTRFLDRIYSEWLLVPSNSIIPKFVECFYWGKNAIPLQIKQLHVFKNYIKKHNLKNEEFDRNLGRDYERLVAKILYNRTLPLLSEHEKDSATSVIRSRDSWFAQDQHGDPFVNFRRGVDYLSALIGQTWTKDRGSLWEKNLEGIYSKPRFLGI